MDYTELKLHDYQEYCKEFIKQNKNTGLFLKMGAGKTLIILQTLLEINPTSPILITAPLNIAKSTWIDEINNWEFPIRYDSFIEDQKTGKEYTKKKRHEKYEEVLTNKPAIYLINNEKLVDMIEFYGDKFPFKTLIIDESQNFKSYNSRRFKALKTVKPYINRTILLTGTPQPNGLMDLWSQIYLLDEGARLGKNITAYRDTFFRPGKYVNGYPVTWIPLPGAKETIYNQIKDVVVSIENTNITLPPVAYQNDYVYLEDKEKELYKDFSKTLVLELKENDEVITANNAAVLMGKLSQMASGAIYIPNDTDTPNSKKDRSYEVIHRHKLEMLDYLIENSKSNNLIAYHFKSDLDMITQHFDDNQINYKVFDGDRSIIKDWNDKKIDNLLIQPQSAGEGLNLQFGGSTLIWYTLPWSLKDYQQTNARIYRQKQTEPVMIHHILTKSTADEKKIKALSLKATNQQELLDAVERSIYPISIYLDDLDQLLKNNTNSFLAIDNKYMYVEYKFKDKINPIYRIDFKNLDIETSNVTNLVNKKELKEIKKLLNKIIKKAKA